MSRNNGNKIRRVVVFCSILALIATLAVAQSWNYQELSNTGYWSWGGTQRFKYDYGASQWWDVGAYGGWQKLGAAGWSAATQHSVNDPSFVGNGGWHNVGTGLWYWYASSGDYSNWTVNGKMRYAYTYGNGLWADYSSGANTWSVLGSGLSSAFLGDGAWHSVGNGFTYWYNAGGDYSNWLVNNNMRFAYTYGSGQWADYYWQTNTWSLLGSGRLSSAFLGDGGWHGVGNSWWYRYASSGDYSNWVINNNMRFAYTYGTGQWADYGYRGWNLLGWGGVSSAFIGDGAYHKLWGSDSARYQYISSSDKGYWSSTGVTDDDDFRILYSTGEWWRFYDSSISYDRVEYKGNRQYLLSDYIYWTSAGLKSTTPTGSSYGTDVQHLLWNDPTNSSLASWCIFTPGTDLKWSGGALDVVVVNNNSESLWMRSWEQYTKEDVITIEYDLEGGVSLSTVLQGLGYLTSVYGKTIDDLNVVCHGNTSGFYFGTWISTSNYISYSSSWTQLNNLMTNGGQLQLSHCETGSAASMLSYIAAMTNTRVFANINSGWTSWGGKVNSSYGYDVANVWNYNYYHVFWGAVARPSGSTDLTRPKVNFVDYDFEYQSDGSGKRAYKLLYSFYDPGYSQTDMVYWWNNGNGRP